MSRQNITAKQAGPIAGSQRKVDGHPARTLHTQGLGGHNAAVRGGHRNTRAHSKSLLHPRRCSTKHIADRVSAELPGRHRGMGGVSHQIPSTSGV